MTDKLREAFERDVCEPKGLRTMKVIATGEYVDLVTLVAWEGFQAGHDHAMRGEKGFQLQNQLGGEWANVSFFLTKEEAKKALDSLKNINSNWSLRIVTYIRQEEE